MPSQQLEVRVRVSGMGKYASEMQRGATATKSLATAGEQIQKVGGRISNVGDKLTRNVTLPIIAVGAAATKMSMDFDNAFTQMQTLAGLSAGEVDGLKESVLDLAGETGKAPQELAEALYFLRSSGLEGKAALDALEVSAKASAAGLGDTRTIADAVSSAMLGYAQSGLEAAEATDVLIATARAGKAEPAELAAQMGRLIPTAAELGITFGDVGGAIAALSTKGNNAEAATTQLVNVMGKLLKPSQQAMEALEGVGLSTDRIRDLIAEKGLLGTLEVLKERLGDSGFVKFFEDQQAVQGALALTGGDLDKTREIFDDVNDSVGDTDKAFQTWADSMGSKNAKAFAQLQVAMIKFGDVIAPIASDLLSFAASVVEMFSKLPEPVQKGAVAFLALVAATGPLMSAGGRLMKIWGAASNLFDKWARFGGQGFADAMNAGTEAANNQARAMGRLRNGLTNAAIAFGILEAAGRAVDALDPVKTANISKLARDLQRFADTGRVSGEASDALGEDFDKLADAMHRVAEPSTTERIADIGDHITPGIEGSQHALKEARQTIEDFDQALVDLAAQDPEAATKAFDEITAALEEQGLSASQVEDLLDGYSSAVADSETANAAATDGAEGNTLALADQEEAVNEAAEAYKNYADTIKGTIDPLFGLLDALRGNQEAQRGVVEAQAALDEAIKNHGRNSAEAAEAARELQDAMLGVGSSALDVTTAAANLNAAVAENPSLLDDAMDALQTWRDQGLIPTDEQLRFLQDQIRRTGLEGAALGEVDPQVDVSESGSRNTRTQLRSVRDEAFNIPGRRHTTTTTGGTAEARNRLTSVRDAALSIPNSIDIGVHVGGDVGALLAAASHHAGGGPMRPGEVSWVGEDGPELYVAGPQGGHVYNQRQLAAMSGRMHSALEGGAGSTIVNNNFDFRGAIITSRSDAERWVTDAWNRGAARGLANVRGKRVA